jgi:hypothetical protein
LHGFTPKHAIESASRFVFCFSAPVIFAPDKKEEFAQVPFFQTFQRLKTFSIALLGHGMRSSWMITFQH